MYLNGNKPFPPKQAGIDQPEEFINYYHDKIKDIRSNLQEEDKSRKIFTQESPLFKTEFKHFKEMTQEEVKEMVFKSPNKFCELDPLSTSIIRDCIEEVLPLLTKIVNLSLTCGEMPNNLKLAIIKLLLKKLGLDSVKKTTYQSQISHS